MKKFLIQINYSWGDEEEPIEIEVENKGDAFAHMCKMALAEFHIEVNEHPEYSESSTIKVFENEVIVHYGSDNEECYYKLTEEE